MLFCVPPRRVGIEGNNAVEGARPVQGQGGEGRSSVGDAVYRQHGFRSVSIQIGDGGRAGSGKIQGGGSRDSAHFIGGSTPRRYVNLRSVKSNVRRISL